MTRSSKVLLSLLGVAIALIIYGNWLIKTIEVVEVQNHVVVLKVANHYHVYEY